MSPSKAAVEHPVLTLIVFFLLGIMGIFTLSNVAIDLFPDTDIPMIVVMTEYENAGPESVEKSVTEVLESALVSVSDLDTMTSTSSEGSSMIMLEFNYGTDLDVATNDIRDKIDRVERRLPDDVENPSIMKMDASSMPIMRVAVRGNRSSNELKEIADDMIADQLEQTAGVAEATVSGGDEKIVRIEISRNRLDAFGLTLTEIADNLAAQNLELGGGKITEQDRDYSIRTTGEFSSIEQIANTVVSTVNGYGVRLCDLGEVFEGYEDKSNAVYINGEDGVYIGIVKQSGKNSVAVANAVYKKLDEIQKTLPSDITLEIVSDDTDQIRDTISILLDSAWQGLLLAVVILFLFLKSMKSTLIISISIPVSIIITLLAMYMADITLNMMTLTGLILGVGMIVDASVVMIDNTYSYRMRGAKPHIAAMIGASEMLSSVVSGNLTTICVFVPFILFQSALGMMGEMFKSMIFTVIIALVSSLFVAIFLVPALAGHFLPLTNRNEKPVKNRILKTVYGFLDKVLDVITAVYRKMLNAALNHRVITILIVATLFIVSIIQVVHMNIIMMPTGQDSSVTLNVELPIGTTLEEMDAVMKQLERAAMEEIQGYESIITSVGTGGSRRSGDASYKGSLSIQLPETELQIDTSDDVKRKLREHFQDFPGATMSFGQGMAASMAGDDLDIAIRSDDLDTAYEIAVAIQKIMNSMDDIGEATIDMTEGLPQVEIQIDRERAYAFGLTVTAVANEINACIDGVTASVYRNNGDDYDMVVMLRPEDREQVVDLEQIYINSSNGRVSVANFAQVVKGTGPVSINREDQTRIIHVTADIVSDTRADVIENNIRSAIAETMVVPESVSISYEGSWQNIQEDGAVYMQIILLAIILVFGVMAGTYESFKAPLINLLTIPMFMIGVVAIYMVMGQPLSMMSMIGIIMLVGIVVNNGIILVDYTTLLRERGMELQKACLEAGVSRLRPVLMTTLTTILGMLPMSFNTEGSAAIVQPIALCVTGGLTSSTFITLLFIPVVYSLVMKNEHGKKQVSTALVNLKQLEEQNV